MKNLAEAFAEIESKRKELLGKNIHSTYFHSYEVDIRTASQLEKYLLNTLAYKSISIRRCPLGLHDIILEF